MTTSQPKDSVEVFAISRALEALAIPRARLRSLTGRELCEDSAAAYLEAAAELTGDATIGINLGLQTPVDGTYTLMYLLMSSATLGAAIDNMVRYVAAAMYQQSRIFVRADADGRMGLEIGRAHV